MEPREERETAAAPQQEGKEKKRRFQIVKLEDRIAPGNGGHTGAHTQCNGNGGGGGGSSNSGTSVSSGSFY
jgi:hypothetical protein